MNKLKELWSKAVFRWCVYQTPLLVFGFLLKSGYFDYYPQTDSIGTKWVWIGSSRFADPYEVVDWELDSTLIWVLILLLPAVWVWRKPLFSWLNKKAEEG